MARRGHHSLEQIKNMVLVAAEDLVIEGGLPQLRVRNIAVKIGYTVGSIYMVFDNMNDLILHIKGRTLDTITEQMQQVKCSNPERCLEELAGVYIRYACQNLNRWSMVFEHRLPDDAEIPEWYQKKVDNLYGQFDTHFALIAPELSPAQRRQTALAFLGGIHGICVFMLTTQLGGLNDNDLEESVVLLVRRFIHDGWMNAMGGITPLTKTPQASRLLRSVRTV
ncbi:transcriptional regulator [Methyloglobulus morosus KoM1]|uniref:Transcriptional regulator n=1 Tax=Methyloglobulus morosus KoM1 TaxID=1116472 RepID=V5C1Y0_9GAMM|nr:helix-turn-helix domain-containing protein [Methyloglobulus morosus]ESS72492.1 transcriptional regulator [Methyloglobulus morosus KoM1]